MSGESSDTSTVLIVDDSQSNLKMLFDFLTNSGLEVLVARNGEIAIHKAEYSLPDLILLDVIMPEMDGFETCQHLKANESTRDIPVIFMTALSDAPDKVKGFNVGAVDYITKPIQEEEVLARVKTHLSIRHLTKKLQNEIAERDKAQSQLQHFAEELERRVRERTEELSHSNDLLKQEIKERQYTEAALQQSMRELQLTQSQLIQSEKMSALGQLVAGITHEINNPVNFISGNLAHIRQYIINLLNILNLYREHYPNPVSAIADEAQSIDLEFLIEDLPKTIKSLQVGSDRIREIVVSMRNFSHHDEVKMRKTNLHEGIDSTLMILHNRLKFQPQRPAIEVIKNYCPNLPLVECYAGEINQVFMNIIVNAIDAIEESNQERSLEYLRTNPSQILICTEAIADKVAIRIRDNGSGIKEEIRDRLFDPFFTTKPLGKGTGIGLSISWQIVVAKHGGSLECKSEVGKGTEFIIEIPIHPLINSSVASSSAIKK